MVPRLFLLCLALSACASSGPSSRAASALDIARRLHFAGCEEAPLLPAETCAAEYRRLVELEPEIERDVAGARWAAAAWGWLGPRVEAAGERVWSEVERWVMGWITNKLPIEIAEPP